MKYGGEHSEQGQGLVEYALLFGAIALTASMLLILLGVNLGDVYCKVASGIGIANAPGCTTSGSDTATDESNDPWSDDFASAGGGSGGWTYDGKGGWGVGNGQMCGATDDGTGTTQMFADGTNGKNYVIDASATLNKGNGYGIFFRASGSSAPPTGSTVLNGYSFEYDPGQEGKFVFRKWVNGKAINPSLAAAAPSKDFQWSGVEHKISLAIHGNTFVASIDGKTLLKASDKSFDEGYVGLRLGDGSSACFNDVSVSHGKGNG